MLLSRRWDKTTSGVIETQECLCTQTREPDVPVGQMTTGDIPAWVQDVL